MPTNKPFTSKPCIEVMIVEIPKGCNDWFIGSGDTPFCSNPDADYLNLRFGGGGSNQALPNGRWKILATTSDITEEKMRQVCDIKPKGFVDYVYNDMFWLDVFASFNSLLTHLSADPERRYLILVNKK